MTSTVDYEGCPYRNDEFTAAAGGHGYEVVNPRRRAVIASVADADHVARNIPDACAFSDMILEQR